MECYSEPRLRNFANNLTVFEGVKAYQQPSNAEIVREMKKIGVKLSEKHINNLFTNPFY